MRLVRARWVVSLVVGLAAVVLLGITSCASVVQGVADPIGRAFPSVVSKSLDGPQVRVPEDFAGRPLIAILATDQDAQFDIDRWLLGLLEKKTPAAIRELPTIAGFVPGLLDGTIDQGMRDGIPSEDWGSVITLYGGEASKLVRFFGNTRPRNGRVVLVDRKGIVRWIHDRGYSARVLLELDAAVRALGGTEPR